MKIYLASSSPRRKEILENLGVRFETVKQNADENVEIADPCALTELLAKRKAQAAAQNICDGLVIGCDTVVSVDGEILGKPTSAEDAVRMLSALSGREHRVISGVALLTSDDEIASYEETLVKFAPLDREDIERYVASGEVMDKAGAYAVQGIASLWIEGIKGDYHSVVGLPVHRLNCLLKEFLKVQLIDL